jgi:hypothetical protein
LRLISTEQEMKLGLAEFDKLKQSMPISRDTTRQIQLDKARRRIAAAAPSAISLSAQLKHLHNTIALGCLRDMLF